jgi:hypothetical protein
MLEMEPGMTSLNDDDASSPLQRTEYSLAAPNSRPVSTQNKRVLPSIATLFVDMATKTSRLFKGINKGLMFVVPLWSMFLYCNAEQKSLWTI